MTVPWKQPFICRGASCGRGIFSMEDILFADHDGKSLISLDAVKRIKCLYCPAEYVLDQTAEPAVLRVLRGEDGRAAVNRAIDLYRASLNAPMTPAAEFEARRVEHEKNLREGVAFLHKDGRLTDEEAAKALGYLGVKDA